MRESSAGSYCLRMKLDCRVSWFFRNVIKFVPFSMLLYTTRHYSSQSLPSVFQIYFRIIKVDFLAEANSHQVLAGFTSALSLVRWSGWMSSVSVFIQAGENENGCNWAPYNSCMTWWPKKDIWSHLNRTLTLGSQRLVCRTFATRTRNFLSGLVETAGSARCSHW